MDFWKILYPAKCPLCGEARGLEEEADFCPVCRDKLPWISEPCCKHCGKPVDSVETELCLDCGRKKSLLEAGTALWVYTPEMKMLMMDLKYGGGYQQAEIYGRALLSRRGSLMRRWGLDALIPVPLHKRRYGFRGYNQAELIGRTLAKGLNLPLWNHHLMRIRHTRPQNGLNDKERVENLKSAFALSEACQKSISGKNILLVDDIYTTGTTLEACAHQLKEAGAGKIYFACLCTGTDARQ
ncbi:MAG: ComF family protein [Eubacterium sp.]|nr:ComF family protein [Eubacterium sp.]